MTNNLGYCLAVEKLLQIEIPPRAQWMRVLLNELTRLNSHLVWLGTHAMDIGALTVFLYMLPRARRDPADLRACRRPAHDDLAISASAASRWSRRWASSIACRGLVDMLAREDRRVRKPAHRQSDLDQPH